MNDVIVSLLLLLLAGLLWVTGAVLHWHTIRRQEKLVARLRRLAVPRAPESGPAVASPEVAETAERPADYLRTSKRWTMG
jgi:hypothetical protein